MSAYNPKHIPPQVKYSSVALFSSAWLRCGSGTERMQHALRKFLVLALSVGLAVSAPALSHAREAPFSGVASHESHDVRHYADLSVDFTAEDCPHSSPTSTHDEDGGVCKKCCAACLGATVMPTTPVAVRALLGPSEVLFARDGTLVARAVPIEPRIPKSL
jgi:hypothetical protein